MGRGIVGVVIVVAVIAACARGHEASASEHESGYGALRFTAVASHGVIPGVQNSCTAAAADGSHWDSQSEVEFWTADSDGASRDLLATGVLGIGRIQPDGSCAFRGTIDFATPEAGTAYRLTVSPTGSTLTSGWNFDAKQVTSSDRARVELVG